MSFKSLILGNFHSDPQDESNFKYYCDVPQCGSKIATSRSNKIGNLKRHLKTHHPEIYRIIEGTKTNHFEIKRLKLIQSCVELVTVNGRPYNLLDDSGFHGAIESILTELEEAGCKLTMNSFTIGSYIERVGKLIREKITNDLKNRLINVMADIATKHHRSFLAINVQYYHEGKIILRTIGMVEMHIRHSGAAIKDLIVENLKLYGVTMDQIHSFTSDNGANIISAARLLDDAAKDDEDLNYDENDFFRDNQFDRTGEIGKTVSELLCAAYTGLQLQSVTGIKCAAHSLQLAVNEGLEESDAAAIIFKCREKIKKLRNQVYLIEFRNRGAKYPIIDVETRWSSCYLMLNRFLEIQSIVDELAETDREIFVSEEEWEALRLIVNILQKPFRVTELLQKINYTLSDFYAAWLQLKLYFNNLASKNNDLARCLLRAMNKPQHDRLLQNPLLLCSVFLDPRVKGILLKNRDKTLATKMYLAKLWKRNSEFEKKRQENEQSANMDPEDILNDFDFTLLERCMPNIGFDGAELIPEAISASDIISKLNEFENVEAVTMSVSVLQFWEENKLRFPELHKLAKIVHSVPAAQASCERAFSIVSFVYSRYRTALTENHLHDILMAKFNKDLFHQIMEEEIAAKTTEK